MLKDKIMNQEEKRYSMEEKLYHLQAFISGPALDAVQIYFKKHVMTPETNFQYFLNDPQNKHTLFHERYPNTPCCVCVIDFVGKPRRDGCLKKTQFSKLYEENGSGYVGHEKKRSNKIIQYCLCKVSAKQSVNVTDIDITLLSAIMTHCCPLLQCTNISRWMQDIIDIRNMLSHWGKGKMNDQQFHENWKKLNDATILCAGDSGQKIEKQIQRDIDRIRKYTQINRDDFFRDLENILEVALKTQSNTYLRQMKETLYQINLLLPPELEYPVENNKEKENDVFSVTNLNDTLDGKEIKKNSRLEPNCDLTSAINPGNYTALTSAICTNCRKELSVKPVETICHESYAEGATSCIAIAEEKRERHTIVEVNCFSDADSESQPIFSQDSEASVCGIGKLEKLNAYLEITNVSPVKEKTTPLRTSCEKTRKKCVSKALECLTAFCSTICPGEGEELETMVLQAKQTLLNEKITTLEQTSFILKEVYLHAESWTLQRQILSIICKDKIFGEIKELLPNVSAWKFNKAKHHTNDVGCGMPVALDKKCRNRVDNEKLEHFIDYILSSNIIKDLPYGTKTMKLSSGEIVEVPNLIRSLAPSSLITQYTQYCEAEDIKPLGSSTLYKILNDCSASVRKCIEGLDYYVAEGGRSFLDLENIIEKLEITDERKKEMISCLLSGKSYLKSDFKVHIEAESNIADHCRLFALSEGEEQCGHSHTEICLQCRNLDEILNEISTIGQSVNWENKDAVLFQVESAVDGITDWKARIMRSRNQEDARLDLVRDLKNGQVLVTCDWAMKMLPRKYREGQTDWFAKRGMNWRIADSVFKEQGCIKNFTHVHIFSAQISQDSPITSSLIKDTVADLHTLIPDIQEIHIYSDNRQLMASLKRDVGNKIKSYNFSEAHEGKGPCDRRASHIKSVIKRYINEGHDVTSDEEMKVAIDARQNGQFRVKVVDTVTIIGSEKNNIKSIAGITQLHYFQFESDGLRVWKAYKIGKGQLIPWKSLGSPPKPAELLIKLNWTNEETVSRSLSTEDRNSQLNWYLWCTIESFFRLLILLDTYCFK